MKEWLSDFLMFRKHVTPVLMPIVFWVGVAMALILGIWNIVDGARFGVGRLVFHGIVLFFAGPFFVRILCEWVTTFFRRED